MKKLFKLNFYLVAAIAILFSSCETNEITRVRLDRTTVSLQAGQSATLTATIFYTGDISSFPIEWNIADPTIISITEGSSEDISSSSTETSFNKTGIIKALKAGTTEVTVKAGGMTVSCEVTVEMTTVNFSTALVYNWGDYYENETNNLEIYLLDQNLSINAEGDIEGNGNMIYFDMNIPLTQDALSAGNFIMSGNGAINTFYPGETYDSEGETMITGSRLMVYDSETATAHPITDGSFSVTENGDEITITGDLTLDETEIIHIAFTGPVAFSDNREKPIETNPALTKGMLVYWGDAYDSGDTNNFTAYLASENYDFSSDTNEEGEMLMLEFNTGISVTDSIPAGSYNMMTELTYDELVPFSLVFGYTSTSGSEWGTWFYTPEMSKNLSEGSMIVSKTGNTYTINYDLSDDIGSRVWGTFNGELTYIDGTQESAAAAPAKVKGLRSDKNSATKKKLQAPAKIRKMKLFR